MTKIGPGAIVDKTAHLDAGVEIGPGAIVGARARIGGGSAIGPYTIIAADTVIGAGNRIFGHCSLGGEPQDKKYDGDAGPLVIGDGNTIREFCFFNRGARPGGRTSVGDGNWIMGYAHIAHDCVVGDDNVIANATQLAGHVEIGRGAVLGGGCLIHQFCRIGDLAMVAGGSMLVRDVPPFCLYSRRGDRGLLAINREGLRRAGFDREKIAVVAECVGYLRRGETIEGALAKIEARGADEEVARTLANFLKSSSRGIAR